MLFFFFAFGSVYVCMSVENVNEYNALCHFLVMYVTLYGWTVWMNKNISLFAGYEFVWNSCVADNVKILFEKWKNMERENNERLYFRPLYAYHNTAIEYTNTDNINGFLLMYAIFWNIKIFFFHIHFICSISHFCMPPSFFHSLH